MWTAPPVPQSAGRRAVAVTGPARRTSLVRSGAAKPTALGGPQCVTDAARGGHGDGGPAVGAGGRCQLRPVLLRNRRTAMKAKAANQATVLTTAIARLECSPLKE